MSFPRFMWEVKTGEALARLPEIPDHCVQTCVTSPPYWGLRDYGTDEQLGLEPTPGEYVRKLVAIFEEVRRTLRDDGTLWLNLGDSYNGYMANQRATGISERNQHARPEFERGYGRRTEELKVKDLVGIPWRVAFALQEAGWWLRSDIVWNKPNPMPESVTDRPTRCHEYIFLLAKSARYFYDADAIREAHQWEHVGETRLGERSKNGGSIDAPVEGKGNTTGSFRAFAEGGRNKRSVWTVATEPYPKAHFATFPVKLIEPCVLAGSPEGGMVLDPFAGAGTTGVVATRRQRSFVGVELNPEYAEMARSRIRDDGPLFNIASEMASGLPPSGA